MDHFAAPALGSDFSDWALLTEEYAKGMEALRRREPGASARMMEIAQLMNQYSDRVGVPGIPAIRTQSAPAQFWAQPSMNWFERDVHVLSSFELRLGRHNASFSH